MRKTLGIALGAMLLPWFAAALAGGALTVQDPYARAVPPGQPNSAVFMRVVNGGDAPRALVGGKSEAAEVVELHTHTMEDGMMKMRRVERIEIPAKGAVSLEPGGLHVMLIGLKRNLAPDDSVALTLNLDDGSALHVQAPVREVQAMDHRHH
jgi:copper(I)-binding protein